MDTIERWRDQPDGSATAVLGLRMLAGEWITSADATELGASTSLVGSVCKQLRKAGYTVAAKSAGGNARAFRVAAKGARRKTTAEAEGVTYPALGAHLTVRALALDDGGNLVVQLSNGTGAAWTARITGHVE